ncbi:hypothetical protein SK128_001423 [Halocaridina rubra]|uniref:Uncharacterized protein n=1 Tax=Halocaridina rubra TaxID=373956 RepID=A0AAN8XH11_HALRR
MCVGSSSGYFASLMTSEGIPSRVDALFKGILPIALLNSTRLGISSSSSMTGKHSIQERHLRWCSPCHRDTSDVSYASSNKSLLFGPSFQLF